MNIPNKILRSTYITYETYFNHQQLAKKFHKSNSKTKKDGQSAQSDYNIPETRKEIKDDLLKW
jgi:hypothetical protein